MKAIRITELGGADKLTLVDIDRPEPGPGEVLVKIEAAGVNFLDIYHRTGAHPIELPFAPGMEAAPARSIRWAREWPTWPPATPSPGP